MRDRSLRRDAVAKIEDVPRSPVAGAADGLHAADQLLPVAEEHDGIEVALGDFGPEFPQGLFVAQDGQNAPEAQNFKLVSWQDIKAALNLP